MKIHTDRQTHTWVHHALIAYFATLAVALTLGTYYDDRLGVAGSASIGVAIYFLIREAGDERRHKKAGTWRTPGPDTVTALVDKTGDLLGPTMNAIIWCTAGMIS